MILEHVPLILILVGIAAYVVLAGADFGAGAWHMLLGGEQRRDLRDHTYHAMGPVWEANHVWLIFVLVMTWTTYPDVFGAIMSTLYVPLFIAAVGIILRGTMYALRGWAVGTPLERLVDLIFGISSLLTPFALGTVIGAIASGRVPADGSGDAFDSWLNPTSVLIGVLSMTTSAYLAAVWLTADGARIGRDDLVRAFRRLALGAGALAGALAVAGLFVLRDDARRIFDGLTSGAGLVAVLGSAAAGVATLLWLARDRYEPARFSAAFAVGAIVAGWAIAQSPEMLPGVTVGKAAAPDATIVAALISFGVGALILVPSLTLLYGLYLQGRFDPRPEQRGSMQAVAHGFAEGLPGPVTAPRALGTAAAACALIGIPLMVLFDGGIGLAAGVVLLLLAFGMICAVLVPAVTLDEGR